jgi:hypothetical protein
VHVVARVSEFALAQLGALVRVGEALDLGTQLAHCRTEHKRIVAEQLGAHDGVVVPRVEHGALQRRVLAAFEQRSHAIRCFDQRAILVSQFVTANYSFVCVHCCRQLKNARYQCRF